MQDAHASQFLQAADLAAHCAFQAHKRLPARDFMWGWYAEHLHQKEWLCCCPPSNENGPEPKPGPLFLSPAAGSTRADRRQRGLDYGNLAVLSSGPLRVPS